MGQMGPRELDLMNKREANYSLNQRRMKEEQGKAASRPKPMAAAKPAKKPAKKSRKRG